MMLFPIPDTMTENHKLKKKVLFIEDEELVRDVITSILNDDNQDITVASTAEEALALFKKHPYDLVLSDMRLPGMDGIQLLAQLKKLDSKVRVVMVTAFGDIMTYHQVISSGALDCINKPFTIDQIKSLVQNNLISFRGTYTRRMKSKMKLIFYRFGRLMKHSFTL